MPLSWHPAIEQAPAGTATRSRRQTITTLAVDRLNAPPSRIGDKNGAIATTKASCLSLDCLAQSADSLLQTVAAYDRLSRQSPDKRGNRPCGVLELDLSGFATNQEL